eukprot:156186-Prymnesium_polylepis.1
MAAVTLRFWSRECGRSRWPSRAGQGCVFETLKRLHVNVGPGLRWFVQWTARLVVARRVRCGWM